MRKGYAEWLKKKQQIISGKQQIPNVPQILLKTESKMRLHWMKTFYECFGYREQYMENKEVKYKHYSKF